MSNTHLNGDTAASSNFLIDDDVHKGTLSEMFGDLAGDLRSLASRVGSVQQRIAHERPLLDPDRARANGRPVRSMELFKEGDFWRWRLVDCDGREYMDGGNFRHGSDAARSLLEAAQLHRLESASHDHDRV